MEMVIHIQHNTTHINLYKLTQYAYKSADRTFVMATLGNYNYIILPKKTN
jgi:hypothetical protein